ncbi:PAS domain S-box-containing protein/diguanylate cyclase (GGDEF)-like protein [Tahibacter aquaticus]|uniref:PAS domain S-box-containing protein/diguanylate cyclase (GGDEF)-like protein n=1 Tax=Tahibacter aquaticus TaxID=520092 RepID=A0A4R6Z6P7_9GAMM|nr:PAS domain S-box-containing protein/diguanylate cyclase (GGDEF)-like protein [Tahibacter aquaticus]
MRGSAGNNILSGILVVERSTTLSHLLKRTLAAASLAARSELATYLDTIDHLKHSLELAQPYGMLIVGVPARPTRDCLALLDFLASDAQRTLPVLLMVHEQSADLDGWVRRRGKAAIVLWTQFSRIPGALTQLEPRAEQLAVQAEAAAVPSQGIRILFVDDSQSVRLAYQQLLERQGYSVATAGTLNEAEEKASRENYDLAIVDYFLPDGNGDELCRRLAGLPGAPTLAIITGTYREDIIVKSLDAGAVECMFKNEAKELFLARVKTLSRQIQMQKSVESERLRLDGILGSVGDGVYGVDQQGVITFINPTGLRLLGYSEEEALIGKSAQGLIHAGAEDNGHGESAESSLGQAYTAGSPLKGHETVFWRRDKSGMTVECSLLPLAIQNRRQGSVVVFRDISERKSADSLRWEMTHDKLTGLVNARHFTHQVSQELLRRREAGGYSSILYIDLDRFSAIVDAAGLPASERLLVEIATALGRRLREHDVLARIEGDRLALMLSGVQLENLFPLADSYRELLHQCKYESGGVSRPITASIGVAVISRETPSAEYVVEHSRLACRTAKQRGRDQTEIYVGEHDARIAREIEAGWTERLRQAMEQERIVLLVQPIVPIAALPTKESAVVQRQGWRVNGSGTAGQEYLFEILIRMVGKDGQLISPGVFVPLAERVGMMPKLDLWVLNRLLRYLAGVRGVKAPIAFHVNLSNMTLADPDSLKLIEAAIRTSGVSARMLVFEITETSELTSLHSARKFISALKKLGCRFALDDFGTGFSSFTHLRHLPVDFVKVEGSFVQGMPGSELDRKMVGSITQLAQSLKLRVIGEHVDSFTTLEALRVSGADYAQGNYLGEPRSLRSVDFAALFPHG